MIKVALEKLDNVLLGSGFAGEQSHNSACPKQDKRSTMQLR
jgi:hypothetical protein